MASVAPRWQTAGLPFPGPPPPIGRLDGKRCIASLGDRTPESVEDARILANLRLDAECLIEISSVVSSERRDGIDAEFSKICFYAGTHAAQVPQRAGRAGGLDFSGASFRRGRGLERPAGFCRSWHMNSSINCPMFRKLTPVLLIDQLASSRYRRERGAIHPRAFALPQCRYGD